MSNRGVWPWGVEVVTVVCEDNVKTWDLEKHMGPPAPPVCARKVGDTDNNNTLLNVELLVD